MRIFERLARLDRAVLPRPRQYDRPLPLWLTFGAPLGVFLGLALVQASVQMSGESLNMFRAAVLVASGAYVVSACRWEREHRRQKASVRPDKRR